MLARVAQAGVKAIPRHTVRAVGQQRYLRPFLARSRTQQASSQQAPSGSTKGGWLATYLGGVYARFAGPRPCVHLYELAAKANIPVETLKVLWNKFVDIDLSKNTGDGYTGDKRISAGELDAVLEKVGVSDPAFRKALFDAFDADREGLIDFREFISGLALLTSKKTEDRAVLVFCLFDLDASREISKDEMVTSIKSVLKANCKLAKQALPSVPGTENLPEEKRAQILAEVTAQEVFDFCDANGNGVLDIDEFRAWLKSGHPSAVLVSSWFEDFSERYAQTLLDFDQKHQEGLSQANTDWLASGRAKSWHDRAVLTGMYGNVDKPIV